MQTQDADFIQKLTQAIRDNTIAQERLLSKLNEPDVPLENKSWTIAQCAAYLNRSVSYFVQNIAPLPDFPESKKFGTVRGESHREWKASDVIKWNMSRFEKIRGR